MFYKKALNISIKTDGELDEFWLNEQITHWVKIQMDTYPHIQVHFKWSELKPNETEFISSETHTP